MNRVGTIALLAAVTVAAGSPAMMTASASPLQRTAGASCTRTAYANSCGTTVPRKGSFSIPVPGVSVRLMGKGSVRTAGTRIMVTQVAAPKRSLGGVGAKVSATGSFKPLHLSAGKLYQYNPGKNSVQLVKTVARAGVYQVVAR